MEKPTIRALILTNAAILEPLVVFTTHVLRMHDSRSCAVITRVLRSLVPEFQYEESSTSTTTGATIDSHVAESVRGFFVTDVLKACITSINEPYFAELQKDLAALVATIIHLYSPRTNTPHEVLQSLPNMTTERTTSHFDAICKATSERQQRAEVLSMLEGVRGTSIHEQGKIEKRTKPPRSALEQQFMTQMHVDEGTDGVGRQDMEEADDLVGVADLLG